MTDCIRFAHRGAPGPGVQANSLVAFAAALRNGAEGIESDVRLTADGVPVLVHGLGRVQGRPFRQLVRAELPPHIPALADLWEHCGSDFALALDMSDPDAAAAVVELARRHNAIAHLWLTYWRLPAITEWRERWPDVHLVYATMFGFPAPLLRRTVRKVAGAGINALNLHHRLVGRDTVPMAHEAGLKLFVWGLRNAAQLRRARRLGADAVFVDDLGDGD